MTVSLYGFPVSSAEIISVFIVADGFPDKGVTIGCCIPRPSDLLFPDNQCLHYTGKQAGEEGILSPSASSLSRKLSGIAEHARVVLCTSGEPEKGIKHFYFESQFKFFLQETEHSRTGKRKLLWDLVVAGSWGCLEEHKLCPRVGENVSHHHVLALAQYLHSLLYNYLKSSKLVSDIMR